MSRRRASKKCRASYIILAVIVVIVVTVTCMAHELNEHLAEITEYRGRKAATEVLTAAVERTMARCGDTQLYRLGYDDSGQVISARLDVNAANRLKNILTEEVGRGIDKLGEDGISIPFGTLLGVPFFTGKGAAFELGVQQLGAVTGDFSSTLESAGINQTRLTVMITVTVEIRAILPDGHTDITTQEEYVINDCMIVGDIPETYMMH